MLGYLALALSHVKRISNLMVMLVLVLAERDTAVDTICICNYQWPVATGTNYI